jgi:hypothetical protein
MEALSNISNCWMIKKIQRVLLWERTYYHIYYSLLNRSQFSIYSSLFWHYIWPFFIFISRPTLCPIQCLSLSTLFSFVFIFHSKLCPIWRLLLPDLMSFWHYFNIQCFFLLTLYPIRCFVPSARFTSAFKVNQFTFFRN